MRQPFNRSLRSDFGDAGDVVDGVADQCQVIDDALRRHAEFSDHTGRIQGLVAHGVDQRHMFVDQLRQIFIAGRDHGLQAMAHRFHCKCTDHIVGLYSFDHQDRPAHGAHGGVNWRNLFN